MPCLQIQPRGLFLDISFGRELSNSTDGTFTHMAFAFPGAHPKTKIARQAVILCKNENQNVQWTPGINDIIFGMFFVCPPPCHPSKNILFPACRHLCAVMATDQQTHLQ